MRKIVIVLLGIIFAAGIGGIGGYVYGVDEGYSGGYNDGRAACPIPTPCSYGIDNCEHMLIIAELIHGIAYESVGEDIETELWDYMRYQLKEEMENEGMSDISEKEWNCFYCDMVETFGMLAGYDVPQDIEQYCKDWGEGVCWVVDDVVVFGAE